MNTKFCSCGKEFKPFNSIQKYCSYMCSLKEQGMYKKVKIKPIKLQSKTKIANPLRNRCDDLWASAVKIKAGKKCEFCNAPNQLNSHHIFSRSNRSTRWDLDNGICLCPLHHTLSSKFSAHKTPFFFEMWVRRIRGNEWYNALMIKAKSVNKPDLEKVKEELQKVIYSKKLPF